MEMLLPSSPHSSSASRQCHSLSLEVPGSDVGYKKSSGTASLTRRPNTRSVADVAVHSMHAIFPSFFESNDTAASTFHRYPYIIPAPPSTVNQIPSSNAVPQQVTTWVTFHHLGQEIHFLKPQHSTNEQALTLKSGPGRTAPPPRPASQTPFASRQMKYDLQGKLASTMPVGCCCCALLYDV